ncbi:MAG: AAA family ATPase [Cyanobacteria bacterium J06638_22]
MNIKTIEVENFRLLESVSLSLERETTVIVGRNNSGKTSLTELFRRLLSDSKPKFQLEDFSLSAHENFWNAFKLAFIENEEAATIRKELPTIEVRLLVSYKDEIENNKNFSALSDFIIDLDQNCSEALIIIRYELREGSIHNFFDSLGICSLKARKKVDLTSSSEIS